MTSEEIQQVREVELLRKAVEQAVALCATLDLCEFVEPINFDADIDASRALKALEERLRVAEARLFREYCNRHGKGVVSLTA